MKDERQLELELAHLRQSRAIDAGTIRNKGADDCANRRLGLLLMVFSYADTNPSTHSLGVYSEVKSSHYLNSTCLYTLFNDANSPTPALCSDSLLQCRHPSPNPCLESRKNKIAYAPADSQSIKIEGEKIATYTLNPAPTALVSANLIVPPATVFI